MSYIEASLGGEAGQGACVGDMFFDERVEKKCKDNSSKVKYKFTAPDGTVNSIHVSDDKLWGYFKANNSRYRSDIYNGNGEILN